MAKLFWRYGTMSAGKSVALLSVAHNYDENGMAVRIYTSHFDDRFGKGVVASRIGLSRPAELFTKETVFGLGMFSGINCLLVDEAQFLTYEQVVQLHKIASIDSIPVICFGIRTDFLGNGFEGSIALGVLADQIEELKQVCSCGKKATMNIRIDNQGKRIGSGEQVQIGGNECYKPKCPVCFYSDIDIDQKI